VLSAELVSREHAIVRIVLDKLEIEDLSSRNGTFVNGKGITGKHPLDAGDVVEIGGERLEVLRRVSRDQVATAQGEALVTPAEKAQRDLLELVEELSARASEAADRQPLEKTIRGLVDTLVQTIQRSGKRLSRGEAIRLVAVARLVADWSHDPAARDWTAEVARAVGQP
jgi:pSer/pThr/pTyr-binding forkhead associated (FHA) protein